MPSDDGRGAEAKQLEAIDAAFRRGDLEALRAAVDDPDVVPNGPMPDTIGPCLIYAIYRSPLAFIRTLLELGADPNAPVDDGFPPLIAALSCGREVLGGHRRTDVADVLRLLLSFGVDPNQRGLNDYTPLHMAVGERHALAVHILLEGGADSDLRTRIDDYETPLEMAVKAGLTDIADILARRGAPIRRRLRSGVTLLAEVPGTGAVVRRQQNYRIRLRMWLHHGEAVRWPGPSGPVGVARLEDDGTTLITEWRIDRRTLVQGLFYGIEGMRIGGLRRLEIAPHVAYGVRGVPGVIPPAALLIAEISVLPS